ncbi:MAG: nucleoside recognition domain-containing protein [bacterium]|nr:nucleoside recognition domain-containing protein [bacterium]
MVNIIWSILIFIGILFGFITNNLDKVNTTIVDSTKVSLEMLFKIFPVLALWMGLTKIAEQSGLLKKLSNKLSFFLVKLFPEIPKGHEALSLIASNMIANIFGLGSAATPFGLKAMQSLQKLNKDKKVASRSMITFLVINTSGLTIIPTTIISLRMMYKSIQPTTIVFACILSTTASTIAGILMDRFLARRYKN